MNSQNSLKNNATTKNTQDTKNLSELSALSGLPGGWKWVKLGEIAKLVRGVSYKKDVASKSPLPNYLPIIRANNINSSLNFEDLVYVPKELIKEEQFIKSGDIVIAMSSGSKDLVGKAAQAQSDLKIAFGTFCGLVRFYSDKVYNKFFGFYFHSKTYRDHISKVSMGVNINNLRRTHIEELLLPLPPLAEQKKIVEKIEELFSQLDSGVAALKKAKEQIRLYRQSVLAAAFSGKLTTKSTKDTENLSELSALSGLPNGWKWVKLGEVAELITKGASPRWQGFEYVDDESQTLFITSENVRENYLDISKPKYLSNSINYKLKRSVLKKGDVLFNLVGASIGRAAVFNLDKESNINQAVALIRLSEELSNKYLSFYLNSENAKKHYMNEVVDFARANLSLTDTANIPIPFCSSREQLQIVSEIEKRFSEADNLEKAIDESLAKAETLRQSILKQAFEGKLV